MAASSSTPDSTQQYEGHVRHQKLIAQEAAAAKARRAAKARKKREAAEQARKQREA